MLRGGKNVCEVSLSESTAGLGVGLRKKITLEVVVVELDPGGTRGGLGEWVGEKKQARSCLGVTDLGLTPCEDWTTAIPTLLACTHIAHGTKERCDHEGFCRPLAQQGFENTIAWRIVRQWCKRSGAN